MSAYGHEVETEYSASLSSGEESDMGSEFRMESVIYMSSFAATIFIGALVTVGVLVVTLLIALMVMLQSCQSRSSGTIEMSKLLDDDYYYSNRYEYCRMGYLHAELNNNYESYSLPEICEDVALKYIKDGHYMRELSTMVSTIQDYFKNVAPNVGGADVVLIDIDDFLLHGFHHNGHGSGVKEAKHVKHVFLLQIYKQLWSGGWSLVLFSREHEKQRGVIIDKLIAARCEGWSELIMRSEEDMKMDTREYFSKQKAMMQANGYNIRAVISSRMDILVGPFIRTQVFKLPNPFTTLEVES